MARLQKAVDDCRLRLDPVSVRNNDSVPGAAVCDDSPMSPVGSTLRHVCGLLEAVSRGIETMTAELRC